MAEWLRRWTRNLLGSPRAGLNPADYVKPYFYLFILVELTEVNGTGLLTITEDVDSRVNYNVYNLRIQ